MNNNSQMGAYSAGFSWGFKSGNGVKSTHEPQQQGVGQLLREDTSTRPRPKKRFFAGEEDEGQAQSSSSHRKYVIAKRKSNLTSSIQGQPLPIHRGLELMNKEQLQNVLMEIMKEHPETQQMVNSKIMGYNFSIEKCSDLLKTKLEALYGSIPYSRSYEMNSLNDYAFVRMKPYILEFLNCLIDCILDQIPPRVENLHSSLKFLDECTDMVTHLPRFQLASNNYYYDKCLEQVSYVWCTVIEHIARDVMMMFNDEALLESWVQKLEVYNDLSNGLLSRPLHLFKSLYSVEDGMAGTTRSAETLSSDGAVVYKP